MDASGMKAGLAIAAVGALAWIVAGLYYGLDAVTTAGLVLLAIGLAVAAAARGAPLAAGGIASALLGMVLFLGPSLGDIQGTNSVASHVFAAGLLALAAGLALGSRAGGATVARAGATLGALGGVLWVVGDLDGGGAWQPGNVLAAVGMALAAWRGRAADAATGSST